MSSRSLKVRKSLPKMALVAMTRIPFLRDRGELSHAWTRRLGFLGERYAETLKKDLMHKHTCAR